MHRSHLLPLATVATVVVVALALGLGACDGSPPPAYPSVRYEQEPFPPPPARDEVRDAGAARVDGASPGAR